MNDQPKTSIVSALKAVAGELLGSKKFIALLVGLLATAATWAIALASSKLGFEVTPEKAAEYAQMVSARFVGLVAAYLVGQGAADFGKEKTKEEAKAS